MVEATLDGDVLTLHGTTGPARVALAGQDHGTDPVIRLAEVEDVGWRDASRLVNGNLTVTTTGGRRYQLHFRRKQADDMRGLYELLTRDT